MSVLSLEEVLALDTQAQPQTVSQKRVLSLEEAQALNTTQSNIQNPPAVPTFENRVHSVLTSVDRSFFENIQEAWKRGDQSADLDQLAYEASMGRANYEKDIRPIRLEMEEQAKRDPITGKNALSDTIYKVAGMLPPMVAGMVEGAKGGMVMALASAGVGAPQLSPVAGTVGAAGMSLNYWYRQGAGSLYADLKDEDVDDGVAVPVAHVAGALYGAVEFSQVSKFIPGGKEVVKAAVKQSAKKFVAGMVARYGVNWAQEVGEEGLQSVIMSIAKDVATNFADKTSFTANQMFEKAMGSGWSAVKETALPMLLFLAPGAAVDTKRAVDARKAQKQAQDVLDSLTPEERAAVEKAAILKGAETETETETEKAKEPAAKASAVEKPTQELRIEVDPEVEKLKARRDESFVRERAIWDEAGDGVPNDEQIMAVQQEQRLRRSLTWQIDRAEAIAREKAVEAQKEADKPSVKTGVEVPETVYAKNLANKRAARKGRLGEVLRDTLKKAELTFEDWLTPISSRLGRIHPNLRARLMRYEADVHKFIYRYELAVRPFNQMLDPIMSPMEEADRVRLDLALKNGDQKVVDALVDKYGMREAFDARTRVLEDIKNRAKQVGFEFDELEHYHPRKVKDVVGFLKHVRQSQEWTMFDEAIRSFEKENGNSLTDEEKAALINRMIRREQEDTLRLSRPAGVKERTIRLVDDELNQFYYDSNTALIHHIYSMTNATEMRRYFGVAEKGEKAMDNIENSVGKFLLDALSKNEISGEDAVVVSELLKARFKDRGPGQFVGLMKNLAYIDVLGNPISAITQLQDLAFSMYKNGWFRTARSILAPKLGKEDIFISAAAQEFTDSRQSARFVRDVFKLSGFTLMDNLGKSTFITAAYDRLQAKVQAADVDTLDNIRLLFGDEADAAIQDLLADRVSENVKTLLFSELMNVQPIALSEMPASYNRGGNSRVLYMLKTYTIKLLDVYRREVIDTAGKDPAKGMANFVNLTVALMLMGIGAERLKDFILGREFDLEDAVVNNIFKIVGFNKYVVDRMSREGLGRGLLQTALPPTRAVDSLSLDLRELFAEGPGDVKWRSIRSIPVAGELLYHWWLNPADNRPRRRRNVAP